MVHNHCYADMRLGCSWDICLDREIEIYFHVSSYPDNLQVHLSSKDLKVLHKYCWRLRMFLYLSKLVLREVK